MSEILSTEGLTKKYKSIIALNGLTFDVQKGQVYGLLGPNGSGKTTTLGMLLGVIQPTGGSFSWFGKGSTDQQRKNIGALLETPNFYPYMNAVENLEVVAKIKEVKDPISQIEKVLKRVNLWEKRELSFKTFSLGMKQRLAIASALINDPEVLVLDEPTNGLDPQGIAEIRSLIQEIAEGDKTIIIASHLLDEIERLCSHVAILKDGKLLQTGTMEEIMSQDKILSVQCEDIAKLKQAIAKAPYIELVKEGEEVMIKVEEKYTPAEVNKYFADQGIYLSGLKTYKKNLETTFLEIVSQ